MADEKTCFHCGKEFEEKGTFNEETNSFSMKRDCCEDCVEQDKMYADYVEKGYHSAYYWEFAHSKIRDLKDENLPDEVWDKIEYSGEYMDKGYDIDVDNNGDFVEKEGEYLYKKENK